MVICYISAFAMEVIDMLRLATWLLQDSHFPAILKNQTFISFYCVWYMEFYSAWISFSMKLFIFGFTAPWSSERDATSPSFLQNPPLQVWPHQIHHPLTIDFNRLDHHQLLCTNASCLFVILIMGPRSVRYLCRIVLANKCLSKLCTQSKRKKKARERVLSLMLSYGCGQYWLEC